VSIADRRVAARVTEKQYLYEHVGERIASGSAETVYM
jgi:hypothetical protein